jgi:hypothetical protein
VIVGTASTVEKYMKWTVNDDYGRPSDTRLIGARNVRLAQRHIVITSMLSRRRRIRIWGEGIMLGFDHVTMFMMRGVVEEEGRRR